MIRWCSICSSAPSEGTLTILVDDETMDVGACRKCVENLPADAWVK